MHVLLAPLLAASLGLPDAESDAFAAAYALKTSGKPAEAAAAFEAIARTYPESPRVGEALVEAGVGWFGTATGKQVLHRSTSESDAAFAAARALFARVVAERPTDAVAGRAQYMLGSTALFQGDLPGAEAEYGAVFERFEGDAKYVPKALERRAAVRRHLLQDDLALEDLLRYQKEFPQGEAASAVARYVQFVEMNGKLAPRLDPEIWLQGGPFTLEALRGKVVGLYFFATWCEKCEKETPFVLELDRRMAGSGLVLIGVFDHGKGQTNASVREFLARSGVGIPSMMDAGQTRPAYLGANIPDLVLIDRAGKVRWHDHPANLADDTFAMLLGEEIAPASPAGPR